MQLHDKVVGAGVGIGSGGLLFGLTIGEMQSIVSFIGGVIALGFAGAYYFFLFRKVKREREILEQKNEEGAELTDARIEAARAEADHWRKRSQSDD
ncbi:MAG: hypothetical protein OXI59_18655 [Gemmatimonadota bacterium]|nr:hypothetical protein [Gemmatimonadota bacterium]